MTGARFFNDRNNLCPKFAILILSRRGPRRWRRRRRFPQPDRLHVRGSCRASWPSSTSGPSRTPPAPPTQTQQQTTQPRSRPAPGKPPDAAIHCGGVAPAAATAAAVSARGSRPRPPLKTRSYKIVFTNAGAQVKHWILKKYTDRPASRWTWCSRRLAARFGLPLSLYTYEHALTSVEHRRSTASGNGTGAGA